MFMLHNPNELCKSNTINCLHVIDLEKKKIMTNKEMPVRSAHKQIFFHVATDQEQVNRVFKGCMSVMRCAQRSLLSVCI